MSTITKPVPAARSSTVVGIAALVFLASKATAFLAPMLLARGLTVANYGSLELALAIGTPSAVIVGLGLHGAVPYFLLKLNRPEARRIFFLHVAATAVILGTAAAVCHALGVAMVAPLALLVAAIFCAQNVFAALLKTESHPALASFTEVALYCVLFVYASALLALHGPVTMGAVYALLLLITTAFAIIAGALYKKAGDVGRLRPVYASTVSYGFAVILSGLLSTLLMSGGRILIGALLGVADVAIFSLLFRMAAAAVLVHQLSTTLIFPKLYTATPHSLNLYLGAIQGAVLFAAAVVCIVAWQVGPWLFPPLRGNPSLVHPVSIVIALQMFYWCASAQCEIILYRENLGRSYSKWLSLVFLVLVSGSYFLKAVGSVSLLSLAQWQFVVMYGCDLGGKWMLWRRNIRLPISLMLGTGVFVAYWVGETWMRSAGAFR